MEHYSRDIFEPRIGQLFEFDGPSAQGSAQGRVQLELLEVSGPGSPGSPSLGFREPFTLLFARRSAEDLGAGLHRIAHPDFEPCDWFLNRVLVRSRDLRLAYYQAVFG